MRFAPYCLVLVGILLAACPDKDCDCENDAFKFTVTGQGASMKLYADGEEVDELVLDLASCRCAEEVTISVTHPELELRAPEPGDGCMLTDASPDARTVEITFDLGNECQFDWYALGPDPTKPIPIVIKPP